MVSAYNPTKSEGQFMLTSFLIVSGLTTTLGQPGVCCSSQGGLLPAVN